MSLIQEQYEAAHREREELRRGDGRTPTFAGPAVEIVHLDRGDRKTRCGTSALAYRTAPTGRPVHVCEKCEASVAPKRAPVQPPYTPEETRERWHTCVCEHPKSEHRRIRGYSDALICREDECGCRRFLSVAEAES